MDNSCFFQAFNSILGKIGGRDYSHPTLSMIEKFCIPVLLYELEALENKSSSIKDIDFV